MKSLINLRVDRSDYVCYLLVRYTKQLPLRHNPELNWTRIEFKCHLSHTHMPNACIQLSQTNEKYYKFTLPGMLRFNTLFSFLIGYVFA